EKPHGEVGEGRDPELLQEDRLARELLDQRQQEEAARRDRQHEVEIGTLVPQETLRDGPDPPGELTIAQDVVVQSRDREPETREEERGAEGEQRTPISSIGGGRHPRVHRVASRVTVSPGFGSRKRSYERPVQVTKR